MIIIKIDIPDNKTIMREVERSLKSKADEFRESLSWIIAIAPSAITVEIENTDVNREES